MKHTRWSADVLRVQRVAAERCEVLLELHEAHDLWEQHSENFCATWLHLPDSDEALAEEIKSELHR